MDISKRATHYCELLNRLYYHSLQMCNISFTDCHQLAAQATTELLNYGDIEVIIYEPKVRQFIVKP
jgi:hypothetical protein